MENVGCDIGQDPTTEWVKSTSSSFQMSEGFFLGYFILSHEDITTLIHMKAGSRPVMIHSTVPISCSLTGKFRNI